MPYSLIPVEIYLEFVAVNEINRGVLGRLPWIGQARRGVRLPCAKHLFLQ